MATSEPELLSADELAKRIADSRRAYKIKILAACWNWEIVAPTLAKCMKVVLETQAILAPHKNIKRVWLEEEGWIARSLLENAEDLKEQIKNLNKFSLEIEERSLQLHWGFDLVPGSLELPLAAQWALREEAYHGVLAIGAVIRGETEHFNLVCRECSAGLQQVALEQNRPVISGLLALENADQAEERIERAGAWTQSLLQMCLLNPSRNT